MPEKSQVKRKRGNPAWSKGMATSPNPAGRGKARNVISTEVIEALRDSFQAVGGVNYLIDMARNDVKTYAALIGKVIPSDVSVSHTVAVVSLGDAMQQANERLAAHDLPIIDVTPQTVSADANTLKTKEKSKAGGGTGIPKQ